MNQSPNLTEKILIFAAYPLWRKNSLVGFARAKQLQDQGHDVTVAYCDASCGSCICNQTGNPVVCQICRTTTGRTAKSWGLKTVPLPIVSGGGKPAPDVTLSERKELVEGVLSGLISVFRILPEDMRQHRMLKTIRRRTFTTSLQLLQQLKTMMRNDRPDRFEVFNGRHASSKSGLIAARALGIPFNTLEVTSQKRPILFKGHTAHDRNGIQNRILSQPKDMVLAEQFYANRRRPRDNKFAKSQSNEFVLPTLDGYRRMVSVFLSSQDEFASLGKSWKSSFDDEHVVIDRMVRRFPDTLFVIRFHPNQNGIKSDITGPFQAIEQQPNVKVYYPTDTANTYQLIDASEIAVVFNSTVAAEACWAGKPVIMIGPSFYDQLEVAYTPTDEQTVWELLARDSLDAKDRSGAAQLAHYFQKDGDDFQYIDTKNAKMSSAGPGRRHGWLTILARQINTVSSEIVKPFV